MERLSFYCAVWSFMVNNPTAPEVSLRPLRCFLSADILRNTLQEKVGPEKSQAFISRLG